MPFINAVTLNKCDFFLLNVSADSCEVYIKKLFFNFFKISQLCLHQHHLKTLFIAHKKKQ